eukprot:COSAG01_NODE_5770_length_4043_cov_192.063118_1_plen_481_part_00
MSLGRAVTLGRFPSDDEPDMEGGATHQSQRTSLGKVGPPGAGGGGSPFRGRSVTRVAPLPPARKRFTDEILRGYVKNFPHMKREELVSLEELFLSWDEDGSGEISLEEMAVMLERVVEDLFNQVDVDGSEQLDSREVKLLLERLGQQMTHKEFREAMKAMDPDGSGEVSLAEFTTWWNGATESVEVQELQDLFSEVDLDGSGEIDVDEFIKLIASKMEHHSPVASESGPHGPRPPMQMVRISLESVRDDVRAIYGSAKRPVSAHQHRQEIELTIRSKRCFWTLEDTGKPACVQFRRGWDFLQVWVLLYISITVPYRSGFDRDTEAYSGTFWFEVLVDMYFIFDIFLNMRTAYRTDDGELITESRLIRQNYLKSWFAIDSISCFPISYIELLLHTEDGIGQQFKALKIFRLLRLAKMLRLARVKRVIKRIDESYPGVFTVSKLSGLIVIILYVSHLFACLWYFAGSESQVLASRTQAFLSK